MKKHTKGPWRMKTYPGTLMSPKVFGPAATDGGDYAALCETSNEAEARLIAAAPELLDVCELVCEFLSLEAQNRSISDPERRILAGYAKKVKEAIGKAKGEL